MKNDGPCTKRAALTFEKNGKHKSRQDELDYLDIFAFPALFRLKRRRNAKRPYSLFEENNCYKILQGLLRISMNLMGTFTKLIQLIL